MQPERPPHAGYVRILSDKQSRDPESADAQVRIEVNRQRAAIQNKVGDRETVWFEDHDSSASRFAKKPRLWEGIVSRGDHETLKALIGHTRRERATMDVEGMARKCLLTGLLKCGAHMNGKPKVVRGSRMNTNSVAPVPLLRRASSLALLALSAFLVTACASSSSPKATLKVPASSLSAMPISVPSSPAPASLAPPASSPAPIAAVSVAPVSSAPVVVGPTPTTAPTAKTAPPAVAPARKATPKAAPTTYKAAPIPTPPPIPPLFPGATATSYPSATRVPVPAYGAPHVVSVSCTSPGGPGFLTVQLAGGSYDLEANGGWTSHWNGEPATFLVDPVIPGHYTIIVAPPNKDDPDMQTTIPYIDPGNC